jgi:hypothetical protein
MPALPKELNASLYEQGALIYGGKLPINIEQQSTVARAFERYRETLEAAFHNPMPATTTGGPTTRPTRGATTTTKATSTTPSAGGTLTQRITAALTAMPAGMTVAQIARKLNAQQPAIQRILTPNVTKGVYVKEGNKYRMSGTAPAAAPATASSTPARSRTRSGSGETQTDKVANLVLQRPGITKAEVITAMAPARPNHVGIWLARLCTANRITGAQGGKDGPYYPTSTTQRAAA